MAGALDIIKVVARMTLLGQELLNVYHFISSDAVPDGDVMADMLEFMNTAYNIIDGAMVDNLSFTDITVTNQTDGQDIGSGGWPSLTTGGLTTDMLPTGIAYLITYPTAILGSRGRKFIPGMSEANTTDGLWTGSLVTTMTTFASAIATPFLGDVSGSPWGYVVVDKDGVPLVALDWIMSTVPAYQRRRKQGVGI